MNLIWLYLLFLAFSISSVAQGRDITRDEYYRAFREAHDKTRKVNRRHKQLISRFENGSPKEEEEWTYEYDLPDGIRYLHVVKVEGKTRTTEEIVIGTRRFCRRDGGEWTVVNSYCIGGSGSGGPSNVIRETYTREPTKVDGTKAILYRNLIVHKNQYSKTAETDSPSFWETKFWVNADGLILRSEIRRGLISGMAIHVQTLETYEYDSKIEIEAPIK